MFRTPCRSRTKECPVRGPGLATGATSLSGDPIDVALISCLHVRRLVAPQRNRAMQSSSSMTDPVMPRKKWHDSSARLYLRSGGRKPVSMIHRDDRERNYRRFFHKAQDGSGSPDRMRHDLSIGEFFPQKGRRSTAGHFACLRQRQENVLLPSRSASSYSVQESTPHGTFRTVFFWDKLPGGEDGSCYPVTHSLRKSNVGHPPDDMQIKYTILVRGGGNCSGYEDLSKAFFRLPFAIPEQEGCRCPNASGWKGFVQQPGAGDGLTVFTVMAGVNCCSESLSVANAFQRKELRRFFIRVWKGTLRTPDTPRRRIQS